MFLQQFCLKECYDYVPSAEHTCWSLAFHGKLRDYSFKIQQVAQGATSPAGQELASRELYLPICRGPLPQRCLLSLLLCYCISTCADHGCYGFSQRIKRSGLENSGERDQSSGIFSPKYSTHLKPVNYIKLLKFQIALT